MKKLISTLLCALMLAPLAAIPSAAENDAVPVYTTGTVKYTDLAADWYREAAEKYGYSDIFANGSLFHPEQTITRMEFIRMLHSALNININYFAATDISEYFTDVKNSETGSSELYDFVTTGIIASGGEFNPDEPLTREVMIHWLIAALDYKTDGNYPIYKIIPRPFTDDKDIGADYTSDVIKSVNLNLIKGRGDNMLFPQDGATRAEAVAVADRLVKLVDSLIQNDDVAVTATAKENAGALDFSLTIQNNSDKTITINQTSSQLFDILIYDASGETLYAWSANKMFMAVLGTTEIAAGDKLVFTDTLDADSYKAIKDKIETIKILIIGTSTDFLIPVGGYEATIK
jgi:S-layer homology domain.